RRACPRRLRATDCPLAVGRERGVRIRRKNTGKTSRPDRQRRRPFGGTSFRQPARGRCPEPGPESGGNAMRSAAAALVVALLWCTGCASLEATKPADQSKAPASKPSAEPAKPLSPEQITPANARQTVNALWEELDRAEEP